MLRAELLIAKGEVGKARESLSPLHAQISKAREEVLQKRKTLLSEAKSSDGSERVAKLDQAKTLLAMAQTYDAQKTQIWAKLVSLASQQGDWQAADQALQEAEAKLGDTPSIRWLRAQKLFRKSGKDAAVDLHSLAENTDAFERTPKLNLFRRLATMAVHIGDMPQAEKLAKKVLVAEPSDVEMQKILFDVARNRQDIDAMEAVLDNIRSTEGKASAFWHYGEAIRLYMLAQKEKDPKVAQDAVHLLSQASRMEPLWPGPTLLLAQILQEQGKLAEATDLYLNAVRNGMQNPTVIRNVASLLTKQHRYREADEMFNRLAQFRDDNIQGINIPASYVKAKLGDFSQSARIARKACVDSNNYRDFLWLGRVLGVSSKRASEENRNAESQKLYNEAEQAFRKATELESSAAAAWIGLVQFYGLFDKKEEALKALEQAKKSIPAKEIDLTLAQAYETLGKVKKAAIYYRKAVRSTPKDVNIARIATLFFLKNNFPSESKMLLKRIADKRVDASSQQVAWAKRTLGLMMIREKGSGDITETIRLIDENLKANPDSALDLFTKASLLAGDPTGLYQEEAIELLERIKSQNRNPGIVIQQELANLYYDTGRWGNFKETMRNILSKASDQPQIIGKYVIRLSEHGEYGEADIWIEKLKKIAPNDPKTFFIECNLIFDQEQYDALLKMLGDWVDGDTKKLSRKSRLSSAAAICQRYAFLLRDENKKTLSGKFERQAEDFMLNYVELEPKAELNLAVLYAQQNQFDKVIITLLKVADKVHPAQFGMAIYQVLLKGDLPESQIIQVKAILKRTSDAHPDDVFTKMMIAFCEEELGKSNQTEAILREILREKPDNLDVTNYLAVMLALHGKKLDEARELIEKAIKIAGPKPDLLDSRAMVSLAQNRPQAAINDLRQAIAAKPSAFFYFHLAEALQKEGLREPAKRMLEKAKKLGFRETSLSPIERRNYRRLKLSLQ